MSDTFMFMKLGTTGSKKFVGRRLGKSPLIGKTTSGSFTRRGNRHLYKLAVGLGFPVELSGGNNDERWAN